LALVASRAKSPMLRAAPTKAIMPVAATVGAIRRGTMRRQVAHHEAPSI
jgi:hypothetical protein